MLDNKSLIVLIRRFIVLCRLEFLLVVCILTRPKDSSKYGTIRKNTRRYYTTKRLIRFIYLTIIHRGGGEFWLITSKLANQRARKLLFTCVVYTTEEPRYNEVSLNHNEKHVRYSGVFVIANYSVQFQRIIVNYRAPSFSGFSSCIYSVAMVGFSWRQSR